jgi:hypothetical protein
MDDIFFVPPFYRFGATKDGSTGSNAVGTTKPAKQQHHLISASQNLFPQIEHQYANCFAWHAQ